MKKEILITTVIGMIAIFAQEAVACIISHECVCDSSYCSGLTWYLYYGTCDEGVCNFTVCQGPYELKCTPSGQCCDPGCDDIEGCLKIKNNTKCSPYLEGDHCYYGKCQSCFCLYSSTACPASKVSSNTCYYGRSCNDISPYCHYHDSCSLSSHCSETNRCGGSEGDTKYYNGQCSSTGCNFSSSDCRCDASETDSGQDFITKGSCIDYNGCSAGGCQNISYTDYCLGPTNLREYYVYVSGSGDSASCNYIDKSCVDLGSEYTCSNGRCVSTDINCIACLWGGDSGTHCCDDDNKCAGGISSCGTFDCDADYICNDKSNGDICGYGSWVCDGLCKRKKEVKKCDNNCVCSITGTYEYENSPLGKRCLDGNWVASSEVCDDNVDNNCDGKIDRLDQDCSVKITSIYVSKLNPTEYTKINISCNSSVVGVDCIASSIDTVCTEYYWSGNTITFINCDVGSEGSKTVVCYIQTDKCYQIGTNKTITINVQTSPLETIYFTIIIISVIVIATIVLIFHLLPR